MMTPHLLRAFLTVYSHLNFTRAADELRTSQPAVSRQIRQLEQELGVALFERLGRSVFPTDAGKTLAPLAEQLLGQIDRILETVRGQVGPDCGRLRVGASSTPGFYFLPSILGRFRRKHPDVELRLTVDNSLVIEQLVLSNDLDLGFIGARQVNKALHITPVADDEIVCFCGPTHPLAARGRISPKALKGVTWIVREAGSATRQLFEQWLVAVGITMQNIIEIKSPDGIKALVRAGIGISFMSIHGLKAEFRSRHLRRIKLSDLRLTRQIYVVRHPDKHESPAMRRLLELMPPFGGQRNANPAS